MLTGYVGYCLTRSKALTSLDQVNVVLIPQLAGADNVQLTIVVVGHRSNSGTIVVR